MDSFGSNATPMGGSAGRADAMVGAVEAQKAEGVLHFHFFIYLNMPHQFLTLNDIATMLKKNLLSAESMKRFVSFQRCAWYPNIEQFHAEREKLERAWPAFSSDAQLSRPPAFATEKILSVQILPSRL